VPTSQRPLRLDLSTDENFIAVHVPGSAHVPGSVRFYLVETPDACIAEVQLDGRLRSAAFCGNGLFVCVVEQQREPVCWHVGKSGPGWSATAVPVPMKLEGSESASCVCWLKQRGLTHQADTWLLLTGCSEGSFCLGKYSPEARQIQAIGERPHKPFTEAGRFVRALLPLGDERVLAVYASFLL
jgi:hypothetical protein